MGNLPCRPAIAAALAVAAAGCLAARRGDYEGMARSAEAVPGVVDRPPAAAELEADEQGLAREARLAPILRLALARNPDLAESAARLHASAERVAAAGRLPDLELKAELWGAPLARPWRPDQADSVMLGVRQEFPAPGRRDAESRAAEAEAQIGLANLRTRQLDLAQQVRRAYDEYVLASAEHDIHVEHAELTERLVETARAGFRAGRGTQRDVLEIGLELTRLHAELAATVRRRRSAAALLNALMARAPDAPLGPPAELAAVEIGLTVAELEAMAVAGRPELAAAERTVARSGAQLDASERAGTWPSFMVGVDYMLMPNGAETHAYGAMVSINLPWLNPQHREEVRALALDVTADRRAADSARISVRYQVHDAYARYQAARETFLSIDRDLLPQARQSFEAAQSTYATGGGDALGLVDALRSLRETRLDRARALVELDLSIGDLERAVGAAIARQPIANGSQP